MHYAFPEIADFEPLRQLVLAVDGGLTIIRKPGHIVVNYTHISDDLFPQVVSVEDALRRECRGIAFNEAGQLISRPLHKFFNVGERPEVAAHVVDLARPHVILDKLDGSMVHPIPIGDGYRLATRSGVSLVTPQPERFVAEQPEYDRYIRHQIARGRTPVFEWCSLKQRIVLDYHDDRLVVIALRENVSGRYVPFADIRTEIDAEPAFAGVEVVDTHAGTVEGMTGLIATARGLTGLEGFVLRFDDGHMLKLKGDWYVTRHRALDGLSREKVVLNTILSGAVDDVKPLLSDEHRARLEAFAAKFWAGVDGEVGKLTQTYADVRAGLVEQIGRNIGTSTRIDDVRWAFGGHHWDFDAVVDS
jgi:RNA ligase